MNGACNLPDRVRREEGRGAARRSRPHSVREPVLGGGVLQLGRGSNWRASRELRVVCIGPVTAKAARAHGFGHVITPKVQTFDALVERILGLNGVD